MPFSDPSLTHMPDGGFFQLEARPANSHGYECMFWWSVCGDELRPILANVFPALKFKTSTTSRWKNKEMCWTPPKKNMSLCKGLWYVPYWPDSEASVALVCCQLHHSPLAKGSIGPWDTPMWTTVQSKAKRGEQPSSVQNHLETSHICHSMKTFVTMRNQTLVKTHWKRQIRRASHWWRSWCASFGNRNSWFWTFLASVILTTKAFSMIEKPCRRLGCKNAVPCLEESMPSSLHT